MDMGRMILAKGNWSAWRKPSSVSIFPQRIPHRINWVGIHASALKGGDGPTEPPLSPNP